VNNGDCEQICKEGSSAGHYRCTCREGYRLRQDGRTCECRYCEVKVIIEVKCKSVLVTTGVCVERAIGSGMMEGPMNVGIVRSRSLLRSNVRYGIVKRLYFMVK
jgi:hypothetical protein